jgi:hypothetical protein
LDQRSTAHGTELERTKALHAALQELSDTQLQYVVIETRIASHGPLWRALATLAAVALLLSLSYVPEHTMIDPVVGLLALLIVALFLAVLAYILTRRK